MLAFPTLHTPRLCLRKLEPEDIPSLLRYANNEKITAYVLNIPYPYREPDAVFRISYVVQGFKTKFRFVFSIINKATAEMIGEISLHLDARKPLAQLGYWLGEPFWNKGIITEAIGAVLQFGFNDLQLETVLAICDRANGASARVLAKNGFEKTGETGDLLQYQKNNNCRYG
jgi:RimJ/RimL family protein N-acetyltransferase